MSDQLTPTRLRELIAAARQERDTWCSRCDQPDNPASIQLREYMDESASSLADALEARELLEWLDGRIVDGAIREVVTNPDSVCLVSPESRETWGDTLIDALRAAKEAADGNR